MSEGKKFFGKYRGKVENNIDPLQQGRLQVSCPAVFGEGTLAWAMPCVPFGGSGVGFFALPPVGTNLWVELEAGDPDEAEARHPHREVALLAVPQNRDLALHQPLRAVPGRFH